MASHLFPPEPSGGAERQADRLARHLSAQGVQVVVVSSGSGVRDSQRGFEVRFLGGGADPRHMGLGRRFVHAGNTYRAVRSLSRWADVFHLHGLHFTHTTLPALLAARRSGTRSVVKLPSSGPEEFLDYYGWMPFSRRIHRWVLRSDALVAVSRHGYQRAMSAGADPRRLHRIPNGIEPDAAGSAAEPLDPDGERYFLFCGTLDRRAGSDLLLEAWREAEPGLAEWKLWVAGYHPDEDRARRCLRDRFGDRVVYHGYLAQVDSLIRRAACLVRPSRMEGVSNSILEAMSLGKPVIASDAGGNPELVSHGWNGLLFPNGDPAGLASRLVDMAARSPEERARMGENGSQRVRDHYSMQSVSAAYLDLYRELLGWARS